MNKVTLQAVGLMLIAMTLIPVGDTAGKLLSNDYGVVVWFIAWSRFFLGLFIVVVISRLFNTSQTPRYAATFSDPLVWIRGVFIVSAISAILTSLKTEPIANVFAAFFVGPIVSYAGAALILNEKVSALRTVLMVTGFCGVLLVVKPGFDQGFGIYYALLAGTFYGCFLVTNRMLANRHPSNTLLLSQMIIGSLLLLPFGLQSLPDVSTGMVSFVALLTVVSAFSSAAGNLLLLFSTKTLGAAKIAPLVYFQLVAATLLGMIVFDDTPDWIAWFGILTIIVCGAGSLLLQRNR